MAYRSAEINANLIKSGAAAVEVRRLLRDWRPGEGPAELLERAVAENVLGKVSRARARDIVQRILARRYFPGGCLHPGVELATLASAELPAATLDLLLYYHAALAEHFLYLCATELLFQLHKSGNAGISPEDVVAYLGQLRRAGRARRDYSRVVQERLARGILTALRDFGVLEGRSIKRIAPVHLPHAVVGYVAYALRAEGHSAARLVAHPDWRLFLLSEREAEAAVIEAAQHGHFRYESAGSIRRFDWNYDTLEDYVHDLAGAGHPQS